MTVRLREANLNLDSFLKYNQPMSTDLNRLDNEITLITGASRGIGAGIAKLFAESGSYVIGTATTKRRSRNNITKDSIKIALKEKVSSWMFLTPKMSTR